MTGWGSGKRTAAVRRNALRVMVVLALVGPLAVGPRVVAGPSSAAAAGDPVIATAGDISCDPANKNWNGGNGTSNACRQLATSNLVVNGDFAAVLPLGDNQYECGSLWAYQNSYDLSWGRFKSITRPSPGNHDYLTHGGTDCTTANTGAAGYYNYFGARGHRRARQGLLQLRHRGVAPDLAELELQRRRGLRLASPQGKWLAADLAAHANQCTPAYCHIPLFSSGGRASSNANGVLAASCTRPTPTSSSTGTTTSTSASRRRRRPARLTRQRHPRVHRRDGRGQPTSLATTAANSEVRNASTFGVLELTLHGTLRLAVRPGGGRRVHGLGLRHLPQREHRPHAPHRPVEPERDRGGHERDRPHLDRLDG